MDLNCDVGNQTSNTTMEMFAKLILDELKLIRKDMKEEISKLRCSMLKDSNISVDVLKENELNLDLSSRENENNIGYFNNTRNEDLNENLSEVSGICERIFIKQEPVAEEIFQDDLSANLNVSDDLTIQNNGASISIDFNNENAIFSSCDRTRENMLENAISVPNERFNEATCVNNRDNSANDFQLSNDIYDKDSSYHSDYNLHNFKVGQSRSDLVVCDPSLYCKTKNKGETLQNEPQKSSFIASSVHKKKTKKLSVDRSDTAGFVQVNSNGEKVFLCKVCGKHLTRRGSCSRHMRIHRGVKPYHCNFCGKSFSERGNMKIHERIHNGEKPYGCNVCGKSFNQSGTLKAHKRIHSGEKPYSCKICKLSFRELQFLHKHERRKH